MSTPDKTFTAVLQRSTKPGGRWTYVVMSGSADYFDTRGLVRIRGSIDDHPFHGHLDVRIPPTPRRSTQ